MKQPIRTPTILFAGKRSSYIWIIKGNSRNENQVTGVYRQPLCSTFDGTYDYSITETMRKQIWKLFQFMHVANRMWKIARNAIHHHRAYASSVY